MYSLRKNILSSSLFAVIFWVGNLWNCNFLFILSKILYASFHFILLGLITSAASLPVDIAKTRIQNSKSVGSQKQAGPVQVVIGIIKNEGIFALWKGFMPYYFRIGPHTVLTFIFLEQFNAAYRRLSKSDWRWSF